MSRTGPARLMNAEAAMTGGCDARPERNALYSRSRRVRPRDHIAGAERR
jgi:hypothetical protein